MAVPLFARTPTHRLIRIPLEPGVSLYGTGEVAGPLLRNGRRTVCWNTDSSDYDDTFPSLYQSHPWVMAVHPDGSALGVLVDTTYRLAIDLRDEIRFEAPALAGPFWVYIIRAAHPAQVVSALADLTGRMPLPPRWTLGYQQSRWSYDSADRVLEIAREFRQRRIPCDVLWLDIDSLEGFRSFTFNRQRFPDPRGLNRALHAMGFRSVWIVDPGIKVDEEYAVYRQGRDGGHFVLDAQGREFEGSVWPGRCAFPISCTSRAGAGGRGCTAIFWPTASMGSGMT